MIAPKDVEASEESLLSFARVAINTCEYYREETIPQTKPNVGDVAQTHKAVRLAQVNWSSGYAATHETWCMKPWGRLVGPMHYTRGYLSNSTARQLDFS
jgi:hypothetical protein